ncbi:MAG: hypothetical protein V1914_00395 [archaeon]
METKKLLQIQLGIIGAIFLSFLILVFITASSFIRYLIILLVIANIVLLFINKTKGLIPSISLLAITFLLGTFLIEYIASILGMIISGTYLLRMGLRYRQGEMGVITKKKK